MITIDKYPEKITDSSAIEVLTCQMLDLTKGYTPNMERVFIFKFSKEDKEKFFSDLANHIQLFTPLRSEENIDYSSVKTYIGPNNIKVIFEDESDNS